MRSCERLPRKIVARLETVAAVDVWAVSAHSIINVYAQNCVFCYKLDYFQRTTRTRNGGKVNV